MRFQSQPKRPSRAPLRIAAVIFLTAGLVIAIVQAVRFSSMPKTFPAGSTWGGLDVGGLSLEDAASRVAAVYNRPLTLTYLGQEIQADPEEIGVDGQEALSAAGKNITGQNYWDFLWNRPIAAVSIPVELQLDRDKLRMFLIEQVAARYDRIPAAPLPISGSTLFENGEQGARLDVEASIARVDAGYQSLDSRVIELVVEELPAAQVDLRNLEIFLKQKIDQAGFDGIVEIAAQDLRGERALHFAYRNGVNLPVDIAFSAASTIKIPIMVSVLRRVGEPIPAEVDGLVKRMMVLSENSPADTLMDQVIGADISPISVTDDAQLLGLQNTFLAGYFYLGAPLLRAYDTPANQRQDVTSSPDIYNQTTAGDMSLLLQAVYQCASENRGLLRDTFPAEMTQSKCEYLLSVMSQNKIGVLFEAGVPEGTRVAHKHGWTEESDGYLHSLSDVGVIYGKQTDFSLVIFFYDPNQLLFTPANELMAQLAQVVYNYFNPEDQIDWAFGEITYR